MQRPRPTDRTSQVTPRRCGLIAVVVTVLLLGYVPSSSADDKRPPRGRSGTVTGTLTSLPPIAQPGTSPAAPTNKGTLVATFTPASPGQQVSLEQRVRRGWKIVALGTEDKWGTAAFVSGPGTYRARTTVAGQTWATGTVDSMRWGPAFEETFSGTTLDQSVWNDQTS